MLILLGGGACGVNADPLERVSWREAAHGDRQSAAPAWTAWRELIDSLRREWVLNGGLNDHVVLAAVNAFWNRIPFVEDRDHWGVEDYWASPAETLLSNGADCEDYVIGKYYTLIEIGVAPQNLRITHATLKDSNLAHMVLAYYPRAKVGADALILDNLTQAIVPTSRRTDLLPVYGFNDQYFWLADDATLQEPSTRIRPWRELRERIAHQHASLP